MGITKFITTATSLYCIDERHEQLAKKLDKSYIAIAIIVAIATVIAIYLLYKNASLREEIEDLEKEKSDIKKEKSVLEKQNADLEREKYDTSKDIREILTYIKTDKEKNK